MEKIALIDDNNDERGTYQKRLSLFLKKRESTLEVIDTYPFHDISLYYEWIIKEDIIALIFDEKLNNASQEGSSPVDYTGSSLVKSIRERFKDIPIFTLTNYPGDPDLEQAFGQFEGILSKRNFSLEHVDIILRACQRYLTENQHQLSTYDTLTKKIASGNSDDGDFEALNALQLKLLLPLNDELKDREDWLKAYEGQIKALEQIKIDLERKIKEQ